ncbi:hypothetical protein G9A89_020971 [Geosiphon pyriformis]|nr:hypothetical protein G9A89_020971 [Geosiphon pyriformis]
MAMAIEDYETWAYKDQFRALLFTLLMETTAHNLGTLLERAGEKTCVINQSMKTNNKVYCAVICFEFETFLESAFLTKLILGSVKLFWTKLKKQARSWIKDKFQDVKIFVFSLNSGYTDAEVAIVMNNILAQHMYMVLEISKHFISVCLMFSKKILVTFLGLYAGASAQVRFGQANEVNLFIAKHINSSSHVILEGDFNENEVRHSANLKKCFGLGLCNFLMGHLVAKYSTWSNLRGAKKTINYVLVSDYLLPTIIEYKILGVHEFFDTNYSSIVVFVGLNDLLDAHLSAIHRMVNKNYWKFGIENANSTKWTEFKPIGLSELILVVSDLPNGKTAGITDDCLGSQNK